MDKLIATSSGGEQWRFFTDDENRMIFMSCGVKKIIMSDILGDFDGVFCASGVFYIAGLNTSGGIDCLIFDGTEGRRVQLVSGKNDVGRISGIRLLCINGKFSLWYCLEYDTNFLLVNQFFDASGKTDAPFAVDRLAGKKCFSVCCDKNSDTNIFYRGKDGKNRFLKYLWDKKRYEPVGDTLLLSDGIVSMSSICDGKKFHLVYVAKKSDYYGVYYRNSNSEYEQVIGFGVGAGCNVSVCAANGKVGVYWNDNYECCECISTDSGKSFARARPVGSLGRNGTGLWKYRRYNNISGLYTVTCVYDEEKEKILCGNDFFEMENKDANNVERKKVVCEEDFLKSVSDTDICKSLLNIENLLVRIADLLENQVNSNTNIPCKGENVIESI